MTPEQQEQAKLIISRERSRVAYWKSEIQKLKDQLASCRGAMVMPISPEIEKRDKLLRDAEWIIINADHRDYPEQWLKDYEELKK